MVQVPEKQIGQLGVENPVGIGEGQPPVSPEQLSNVEGGQVMPAPVRPVEVDPPKAVPNTGEITQPIPPDGNAQLAQDMAAPVVPVAPKTIEGDPYVRALGAGDDVEGLAEAERRKGK